MEFVSNFNAEIVGYIRKRFREGADDPTLTIELHEKWPTMFSDDGVAQAYIVFSKQKAS